MRKVGTAIALGVILMLSLAGCVSQQSAALNLYDLPANAIVLGHVEADMKRNKGYSYTDLLAAAQKKYPGTEEVVRIQLDYRSDGRYVMHGLAVKY